MAFSKIMLTLGDIMSTIEFEAQVKDGIIRIPDQYKELENAFLKIKIQPRRMKAENNKKLMIKQLLERIIRKNVFKNITSPDEWQRNMRDEWEKGIA